MTSIVLTNKFISLCIASFSLLSNLEFGIKHSLLLTMFPSKTTVISQYQPTVLITTQQAHPWTISGFNGLNGNVLLTFKCDAPVTSHGLLCSRNHIYAAAIDRPSIYVWNLNSRVYFLK